MKYSIFIFAIFIAFSQSATAQQKHSLTGSWKGYISINGHHLIQKVYFKKLKAGYRGTLDIPQQGAKGLQLKKISVTKDDSVFFQFNGGINGAAKFKGYFKTDSTITGNFHQNGFKFPFKLTRYTTKVKKPKPKLKPYHHKDIIIQKNDSIQIGGTLTWPKKKKADQLVIMITGSGAENRDEEIFGFKIFGQIADYLTRHGIATFRYDDRGVGESTGNLRQTSMEALASDTRTIVDYFANKSDQTFNTITLLGHSEGGMIAGRTAARDTLVNKVILMSSPAFSLSKILPQQKRAIEKASGTPDSTIKEDMKFEMHFLKSLKSDKNAKKYKPMLVNYMAQKLENNLTENMKKQIGDLHAYAEKQVDKQFKIYQSPSMASIMYYDPAQDLKQLNIPVLALFGKKDTQVLYKPNSKRMRKVLQQSNADFTIKIIDHANHLYQHAKTGSTVEYMSLPKKFTAGFLPTVLHWLKRTENGK
jgi:pimeloyl-ACP methyl ester carboxylesterase